MKTGHKSMFNSLPRSFNCLRTESADVCSLNGRTIRTDYRSDVELRGDAGVFFFFCFTHTIYNAALTLPTLHTSIKILTYIMLHYSA